MEQSYYHVYNRGVNKQKIFVEKNDYVVFLSLLKRYLSGRSAQDNQGRDYVWLGDDLELLAFCLMPNHFHLLVFQNTETAMEQLMRGVGTAYTMYFNTKYKRVGPLFQSSYKASMINHDAYLDHISRYIHLNPEAYKEWEFSSLPYYLGHKTAEWIRPARIMELFENSPKVYSAFVADYHQHKVMLDRLKPELAN